MRTCVNVHTYIEKKSFYDGTEMKGSWNKPVQQRIRRHFARQEWNALFQFRSGGASFSLIHLSPFFDKRFLSELGGSLSLSPQHNFLVEPNTLLHAQSISGHLYNVVQQPQIPRRKNPSVPFSLFPFLKFIGVFVWVPRRSKERDNETTAFLTGFH